MVSPQCCNTAKMSPEAGGSATQNACPVQQSKTQIAGMGLGGILELAAPYSQPWSAEALQVTTLLHSHKTCLIPIPADQTGDRAAVLLSSPKMARAAPHPAQQLQPAFPGRVPEHCHLFGLFYCRASREAQAAAPVLSLIVPLTSSAKLLLLEGSHPLPCRTLRVLLTRDSSWVFPAGTSPQYQLSTSTDRHPRLP